MTIYNIQNPYYKQEIFKKDHVKMYVQEVDKETNLPMIEGSIDLEDTFLGNLRIANLTN